MLLSIIEDKRKLIPALLILYILSWELSVRVIFPLEANLGWRSRNMRASFFSPQESSFFHFIYYGGGSSLSFS